MVEHEGAHHSHTVSREIPHDDSHHDDEHQHDGHDQHDSESPIHHHHVEVSTVLVIALTSSGDFSLLQPIVPLPTELFDELCPPSPSSEIVKPPQVA
jgi:hypothetical protein